MKNHLRTDVIRIYIVQTLELNTKIQKPAIKLILWRVEQRDTIDINGKCLSAVTLSGHNWNGVQCNCDPFYPENWWFIHAKINHFESFINRKFSNTNQILFIDFFFFLFRAQLSNKWIEMIMTIWKLAMPKIIYLQSHCGTFIELQFYTCTETYTVHWFIFVGLHWLGESEVTLPQVISLSNVIKYGTISRLSHYQSHLNSLQIYQNQNELVLLGMNIQTRTSTNRLNVQNVLTLKDKTIQTNIHFLWNTQRNDRLIICVYACLCLLDRPYTQNAHATYYLSKSSLMILFVYLYIYIYSVPSALCFA